eukprot:TRINITY_DN3426_c0_g1_i2.p1 TRINITY_DN3426_c0_g1~~TRINITY_DN3426_c0_g1_i2.p1  ORF type:complete len:173 (+),score=23.48 TRINITY_DN3426_c0_g1_i2:30-548(+)
MSLNRSNKQKNPLHLAICAVQITVIVSLSIAMLISDKVTNMMGYPHPVTNERIILWSLIFIVLGIRNLITFFYLLERAMALIEVFMVIPFLGAFCFTFAFNGSIDERDIGGMDLVGLMLYFVGSYWNTGSEYARKKWKEKKENKGKLYTEGLNRFSQHPNYFGDSFFIKVSR